MKSATNKGKKRVLGPENPNLEESNEVIKQGKDNKFQLIAFSSPRVVADLR